jgi:branched-chain amino acid transport system ATP-binding protein
VNAVLELEGVSRRYGSLLAVDGVSLDVERGARHALIGPNGAGKSTLFNLIAGTVRATDGRIVFDGVDVTGKPEYRRTQRGMGRTFQHSSLFSDLATEENIAISVQQRLGHGRSALRPASTYRDVASRTAELQELVGLQDVADVPAASLSYGHARQLEVALALATEPTLLLMDEPTAGMSRQEAQGFLAMVGTLPEDLTILLVEHDMDVVFGVATWISVLDAGRLIASGPPNEIRDSVAVQEAYLGPGERMEALFESP